MMKIKFNQAIAAGLAVLVVAGASTAAECFKQVRQFPTPQQSSDKSGGSCGTGNRAEGGAFYSRPGDDTSKAVSGIKKAGTQNTFVNGVTSSNATITGCGVMVNDPSPGASKTDLTGCLNATKWQIRMFD